VFVSGLVRRSLSALALLPVSRVAERCPLPFHPAGGAEAEAPLGLGVVPDWFLFSFVRAKKIEGNTPCCLHPRPRRVTLTYAVRSIRIISALASVVLLVEITLALRRSLPLPQ
jgi:hypothetical protein